MTLTQMKMSNSLLWCSILCFLLVAFFSTEILADYGMAESPTIYSNFMFQEWNRSRIDQDVSVRQFSLPLFITFPISKNFRLFISEANSMSLMTEKTIYKNEVVDEDSFEFNGMSDTQIQALYSMANGQILLSCGVNLPTGKNELKSDEEDIVVFLRQEAFDFSIGKLGEGYGYSLGMAVIKPIGPITFGAGTSYFSKASYPSTEGDEKIFNPGDLVNFAFGFDTGIASITLCSDFSYAYNTSAQLESEEFFRQGNLFNFDTELAYQMQRIKLGLIGRGKIRSKDYGLLDSKLQENELNSNNNRYEISTFCRYRMTPSTTLLFSVDRRLVFADDRDNGEAKVWGVNTTTYFNWGDKFRLNMVLKVSKGKYTKDDTELSGISFATALIKSF